MKRILLAFSLFVTVFTLSFVQQASAQAVTAASFTAKVNLMDSYISAGNSAMAQSTFDSLNVMMKKVLGVTKMSIKDAATPAAKDAYKATIHNQISIYEAIWALKPDLMSNKAAIDTKLAEFDATIY